MRFPAEVYGHSKSAPCWRCGKLSQVFCRKCKAAVCRPSLGECQLPHRLAQRNGTDCPRPTCEETDLLAMSKEQLQAEVMKLRNGIRAHRDSSGHDLCWYHPALWGLLPERTDPVPKVPVWPKFMEGCLRFRQSLDKQAPFAPRTEESFDDQDE